MSEKKVYDVEIHGVIDEANAMIAKYQGLEVKKVTLGEKTARWFELKATSGSLDAKLKEIKTIQESIEASILEEMESMDIDKLETKFGSMTRSTKMYASVNDMDGFLHWISDDIDNRIGFIGKTANNSAVGEMFEDSGMLPPGVTTYMKTSLNKRSK